MCRRPPIDNMRTVTLAGSRTATAWPRALGNMPQRACGEHKPPRPDARLARPGSCALACLADGGRVQAIHSSTWLVLPSAYWSRPSQLGGLRGEPHGRQAGGLLSRSPRMNTQRRYRKVSDCGARVYFGAGGGGRTRSAPVHSSYAWAAVSGGGFVAILLWLCFLVASRDSVASRMTSGSSALMVNRIDRRACTWYLGMLQFNIAWPVLVSHATCSGDNRRSTC